ncbi:MAG: hypothetical protein ACMXYL_04530 [Candidatus Woesearchaeota archaeon]
MEKRKFIIGSIFGMATVLTLSAASELAGLDIFITIILALLALPFVFAAFMVSAGTRKSEGIVFAMITQITALITIVLSVLDSLVRIEYYIATLALGFITVMLLFMEKQRKRRRMTSISSRSVATKTSPSIQKNVESETNNVKALPPVPAEKKKTYSRFVASKTAVGAVVHRNNCRLAKKIKPKSRVRFETYSEALEKGYVPCKVCMPDNNGK